MPHTSLQALELFGCLHGRFLTGLCFGDNQMTSIEGLCRGRNADDPHKHQAVNQSRRSLVTTSYDPQASSLTTIPPTITGNTAIHTSDGNNPLGLYPFVKGGPLYFFCPPGINLGGLIL